MPLPFSKLLVLAAALPLIPAVHAQDWPQWRGPQRDARAAGFRAPATWPGELVQKWKVVVGEGVATPALVGDRLFVFSRQNDFEMTRCLAVGDGKELWQDKYESLGASGPAASFSGPRSSPAVADGKVVTLGVRGMVSGLEAATGKVLWRKDDFHAYPNFHPSSSPMIWNGLALVQVGGRENGALVAYDLATGNQKWSRPGPSPSYASPVMLKLGGADLVIAQTESKLLAVNAADGALVWESAPAVSEGPGGPGGPGGGRRMGGGGGRDYRATTPIVDGSKIIVAGRGVRSVALEKAGDKVADKEQWNNADPSLSFSTPVLKDGKLYGLTGNNELICLDAKSGAKVWQAPFPSTPTEGGGPRAALDLPELQVGRAGVFAQADPGAGDRPPGGRPGGPGGGRGMRGGGQGYGAIVDAGTVLMALTPGGELVVFDPNAAEFKMLAKYRVASGQTHAYPVVSGNRIFVKDGDSVALWTLP